MEQPNYWQRLARKRLTRRRLLAAGGATALGGAAALIVGCGSSGNNGSSSAPARSRGPVGSPVAGGNVTFGRLLNVGGIDPHIDLTGLDIDTLLYSYLYSWQPGAEQVVTNNLAMEFENPDPLHFIFKLRPGVKIAPNSPGAGEDMTAEDCIASFERRGTSLTAPDKRFPMRIVKKEAPDPYTFNFELSRPFVPSVREMANPTWAMVPKKVLDQYQSLAQVAFGSGPFMLDTFRGSERIVLKKNPDYFLKPRPWLDSITHIVIQDGSSLRSAFDSGQHDVNGAVLSRQEAEDKSNDPNFVVGKAPSLFYPVIQMKMKPPFDDIRVREAIDLALNRDEFIETIQDGQGNYNGPIQWPQVKWALPQEELRSFYQYNPDLAKQRMREAGQEAGFDVKMKIPSVSGADFISLGASLIKNQLSKININIQINEVELGAFISSTILPGNFQMTFFPNLPYDEPDRPLSFYHSLGVTGTGNWTNYSNKDLDKLIDAQAEEFDPQKRQQIIFEAQRMILKEHGPQITLTGGYAYSAHRSYVHFPYELGQDPPKDTGPFGVDIWREQA